MDHDSLLFHAALEASRTGPTAQDALDKVSSISAAVCTLKTQVFDLERVRDQARIHLQSLQRDYDRLNRVYNQIKHSLDKRPDEVQQRSAPEQAQEGAPEELSVMSVEPAQMSLIKLSWHVTSHSAAFPQQNISLRFSLSTPAVLCTIQFDPTGECVAFSDGRHLHVVSAQKGELMYSMEIPKSVNRNELHTRVLRFSHDGRLIALSSMASAISIFSTQTRKCIGTLEGHKKAVTSLLFMNESKTLLSGSYDGLMCIWDVQNMSLVRVIQHGSDCNSGKLNQEGAIVAITTDKDESFVTVGFMSGFVGIYEPSFAQPMNTFSAHSEHLLSVENVPGDSAIVTTSHDKTAKLWMLRGVASCKHVFNGHTDYVLCVAMAKDSGMMITGSKDETIRGWDRKTGEPLFSITGHRNTLFEVHHHPTQHAFVSCSGDGFVCVWDYKYPTG